ncbi:MAG: HigA family addiction module antidote protein, partial [Acidobacteria bacterium]|nr:HigA family addiction module antidote protein [Acidobacteriota bacterium]
MTTKSGMAPVHPGEVLREELSELGLSARALAKAIDVPVNRVTAILNGNRGITADTALRLGRYFDTTAQFWLNLQQTWQIRQAEIDAASHVAQITPRQVEVIREAAR